MTRGQIRALASVWLDDVNNGYFKVDQLNVWINNAQREVQKMLLDAAADYYTVCATTSTVINQAQYALPPDFFKLMRLSFILSGTGVNANYQRLYPMTRNEVDLFTTWQPAMPTNFWFNKDTLTLAPTPNQAWVLHLDYAYQVQDMTDDAQEPDCPEQYHEYLAILTARDGFLRDGRSMDPINDKLKYFQNMMEQVSQDRHQDSPRKVVRTRGGWR